MTAPESEKTGGEMTGMIDGLRQESGTGAVNAAAVASTVTTTEEDERDFPLRVMT